MAGDFEQEEYFAIVKAVADFDQRLLVVKGWGVTLSLVALGLGFQFRAYGFFLVASASSLAFWLIETAVKRHPMRHYLRMREIEVNRYERADESARSTSAPRIDWSWQRADRILSGKSVQGQEPVCPRPMSRSYRRTWAFPHVALPHAITLGAGLLLYVLGLLGWLGHFSLGSGSTQPPPVGGL